MLLTRTFSRSATEGNSRGITKPQMTSLVDMLTILLVFLLKSFSVEGNLVAAAEDLQLPESSSEVRPVPTVNVEITTTSVNIDGNLVVPLGEVLASDSLCIAELETGLNDIARATGRTDGPNEVTIHCDKRLGFEVIKKVMFTCAQAGFSDFSLLVLKEG